MKNLALIRFKYTPFGGAENYLSRLVNALGKRGTQYRVVSTNWEGGESIFVPKFLPSFLCILLFAVSVCLKKQKEDVYFSLERVPCADVYRAGDGVHRAWLDTRLRHGESALKIFLNPLQFTYLFLEKKTFANAKKIIANSHFVKQNIIAYYGTEPSKISVVYNGVLPNTIDATDARSRIENEFGIKQGKKIILFVGSGFIRKGVAEFLELLSRVQNKNFVSVVVGKDKHIGKYKELADKLGVEAIFTGPRRDADLFYAAADIFLFPTLYEPFSNVCLEAMTGGCAVITTAQNGAAEVLNERFVMKNPSDYDILETIERLLSNDIFLSETQSTNMAKAAEFSVERNLEETLKVLESL
jgi:UDP-glucose:(heptosyl)LPS alpha-1,3-glucosyltransferase